MTSEDDSGPVLKSQRIEMFRPIIEVRNPEQEITTPYQEKREMAVPKEEMDMRLRVRRLFKFMLSAGIDGVHSDVYAAEKQLDKMPAHLVNEEFNLLFPELRGVDVSRVIYPDGGGS
jgi:uncharacterized protein (DUF4415 family)